MAGNKLVLKNAELIINSVDLSAWVTQISLTTGRALLQAPALGEETNTAVAGLKEFSGQVTFNQAFDAGAVDETLSAIDAAGVPVWLELKSNKGAAVGPGNPKYIGLVAVGQYQPFAGSNVGQILGATISFQAAADAQRLTA